jgi:hypothetical protein
MASEYQLTANPTVIRNSDMASIPDDPANRDRQIYIDWVANGGVPDPYVPPDITPVPPQPTPEDMVLYDHENRLRAIEGEPPLELDAFMGSKRRS